MMLAYIKPRPCRSREPNSIAASGLSLSTGCCAAACPVPRGQLRPWLRALPNPNVEPWQRPRATELLRRAIGPGLIDAGSRPPRPVSNASGTLKEGACCARPNHPSTKLSPPMLQFQESSTPSSSHAAAAGEATLAVGTAPEQEAIELARTLVGEQLVACVNLQGGARSIYRWQGEVCDAAETVLVMKTTRGRLDQLARRYVELHSYDVPEFLVVPIAAGHRPYLEWIAQVTVASP